MGQLELRGVISLGVSGSCIQVSKLASCPPHSLSMWPLIPQLSSLDFHIGWGLGSKGKKVEASSPYVGSAVSEHHCCSGRRMTSPHREQQLDPTHTTGRAGGLGGGAFGDYRPCLGGFAAFNMEMPLSTALGLMGG